FHSAGGDLGRSLTSDVVTASCWLLTAPIGFALLWPRTARRGLEALPGALRAAIRAAWRALVGLGIHRAVGRGFRRLLLGVWHIVRPARAASVADTEEFDFDEDDEAFLDEEEDVDEEFDDEEFEEEEFEEPLPPPRRRSRGPKAPVQIAMDVDRPAGDWRHSADGWQIPPLTMLKEAPALPSGAPDNERRAQLIVDTLASFGVDARVTQLN